MQNTRVRNLFSTILGAGVVAGGLVLSSCEDEFTEQDAIKAQQETLAALKDKEAENDAKADSLNRIGAKINYSVTVIGAGQGNTSSRTSGTSSVEGATVTVVQGGKTYTETAGKGGVATFVGLLRGDAIVTIEATDHTTVTYTTTLGSSGGSGTEENSVSSAIPVFPLTVEAGATEIKGMAWAELDATNDAPEAATGAKLRATLNTTAVLNTYGRGSGFGSVRNVTYQDFVREATVGDDGTYSLIVPNGNGADGTGFTPTVDMLPFVAKQKYAEIQDGKLVTMEKDVLFGDGGTGSHIPNAPSVFAEIEAPAGKAEGFTAKAELVAQDVDGMINDDNAGSGYAQGNTFELSADKDGNKGLITVDGVDQTTGAITKYSYDAYGAMYTEVPTIAAKTIESGATGAKFSIDFTPEYQVVVENVGSGYWATPEVNVVYNDPSNGTQQRVLLDLNDDDLNVEDGEVGEKSDNIGSSFSSTTMPTITVINPVAKKAMIESVTIADGKVTGVEFETDSNGDEIKGEGYMTNPKVTFKDASGNEAGAAGVVILSGSKVGSINITNPGSGFKADANDKLHDVLTGVPTTKTTKPFKPGTSNVGVNFNFGAGKVQ